MLFPEEKQAAAIQGLRGDVNFNKAWDGVRLCVWVEHAHAQVLYVPLWLTDFSMSNLGDHKTED